MSIWNWLGRSQSTHSKQFCVWIRKAYHEVLQNAWLCLANDSASPESVNDLAGHELIARHLQRLQDSVSEPFQVVDVPS